MIVLCCFSFAGCSTNKGNNSTEANAQIINLADDTVKSLKEKLKMPSSLHINSIVVSEISGSGIVLGQNTEDNGASENTYTYTVYIDYSAENSIGENTKAYFSASYYVSGDDVKILAVPHEISSIPQLQGTTYEIDKSKLPCWSFHSRTPLFPNRIVPPIRLSHPPPEALSRTRLGK